MRKFYLAATVAALFFAAAGATLANSSLGPKPTTCPPRVCLPSG
jgi:hypothetical protein